MARRGEARRDLWDLVYANFSSMFRLCFEHAVIIIDSERNKVGYTLLYETTVLKYNTRFSFLLFKSHGTAEGMNRVQRRFVSTSVEHRTLITCIRFSVRMVYPVSLHFVIIRTYMNDILKV